MQKDVRNRILTKLLVTKLRLTEAMLCFSSSIFPHFRHSTSPLSSWEIPHFQQALSGYRFHNCVLPHKGMFHSVASSTSHQEMAVVSQSVNHGSGHLFIGEDAAPF